MQCTVPLHNLGAFGLWANTWLLLFKSSYNFLNSPISNYVSSFFPDNPFSVTLGTEAEPIRGDTVYNNRTFTIVNQPVSSWESPLIPNAHRVGDEWGYNLPTPNSTAGQGILELPRSVT